ncbi:hypothetical protein U5A82_14840 [Sphingobium sp. CR2-8]|uniref:hypothetical protein n=1 Tax=Sphingobium sp. CR2-8 TaxID=1306534 RepID=UPI002DB8E3BA|nr:hypothetical protein [Sphingobium sp. CR2-8]MEC3911697.1 hypothetical protein [Sphingobium sp. CR2-8]
MTATSSGAAERSSVHVLAYRPGRAAACPDCGERQWIVGRVMAECACCEAVLPIDLSYRGWSGAVVQPVVLEPFPIS